MSRTSTPHLPRRPSGPPARVAAPAIGRRERHRQDVRARLFRAAIELFGVRGFTATTVEDITELADVGKGTFFNYFPSKEHLLMAYSDGRVDRIRAALEKTRTGKEPISSVLRHLHRAMVSESSHTQQFACSMLVTMISSIPVRKLACTRMEEGRALGAQLMAIGQERGEIRSDVAAAELYFVFQQIAFGAVFFFALKEVGNREKYFKSSFDIFWSGIEAHPPSRIQGNLHHGK
jgi:TetR/AcrR family transcriptional regulator, cholesterol catabolism regulator